MMGERRVEQDALFYEFSLERHVPAEHLLRSIDRFVDLDGLRRASGAVLQRDGPAFDRSGADDPDADRRLLLRHPLGAAAVRGGPSQPGLPLVLPARARRRRCPTTRPSRRTGMAASATAICCASCSRRVLQRCIAEGLVGGEGFAVDASLIKADASDRNRVEGAAGLPPEAAGRAVEEYLAVLDDAAFGAATRGDAEVHLAGRSGGALDRRARRAGLLRLLRPTT